MSELLKTGFVLMATGMGTVFVLLATLVLVVHAVSRAARWLGGASAPVSAGQLEAPVATAADSEIAIVIGAAVSAYRSPAKRQELQK
jgi:sodium pump decarboxylase gamma subunit